MTVKPDRRQGRSRDANGRYVTKLSQELADELIKLVGQGVFLTTASAAAGVSKDTFHQWLREGKDVLSREEPWVETEHESLMAYLAVGVQRAIAKAETDDWGKIGKAADEGVWTAAAWRLERKFPERYGRSNRVAIENADGRPFQMQAMPFVDLTLLDTDEVRELKRLLEKATPNRDTNVIDMPRRKELTA